MEKNKLGVVSCIYQDPGKPKIGGPWSRLTWAKKKTLSLKITRAKRQEALPKRKSTCLARAKP
jgi:hypothetical protein